MTHDQNEAMVLSNRIGVMNAGVLQQVGTPQSLYEHPSNLFVAGFIGSPPMNTVTVDVVEEDGGLSLEGYGFKVPVPEYLAARLSSYAGRQIVLGIRPEHILDARYVPGAAPGSILSTRVEIREYLGSGAYLHLRLGSQQFVAHVSSRTEARQGDGLDVVFDMDHMHAFDPTSERTLL